MDGIKRRILVVDDNIGLCQTVQYLLEKDGPYEVQIVSDSTKTLETIYEFRPELILLDITMPDINGYDICQHVKTDKILNFIKIIFVTGNVTKEQRLRGYEVGADDYLTKPFENEELLAKVRVYLRLKYTEEISQIKSNVLSVLRDEKPGLLKRMLNAINIFHKKSSSHQRLPGIDGWEELARGKTSQAYNYIKNAIFLNRIMEGLKLSRETVEVENIIKSALRKAYKKAEAKRITFQVKIRGEERKGELDRNLTMKAFLYIVTNVIRHSKKRAQYQIIVNYDNPERCEIYIEDSGHDFDDKNCDEVFNAFMEFTHKENKRGQDLSIVCAKRIAQLHEGDLTFQTDYEGSFFWVFQIRYTRGDAAIDPMFY